MGTLLCFILFFLLVVHGEDECLCKTAPEFQQAYCGAGWISRVKILSRGPWKGRIPIIEYDVQHIKVYKASSDPDSWSSKLYGGNEEVTCSVVLEEGKQYLLTGIENGGDLFTGMCGQLEIVSDIQPDDHPFEELLRWKHMRYGIKEALETEVECPSSLPE